MKNVNYDEIKYMEDKYIIADLKNRIETQRRRLEKLWVDKGHTDHEVLRVALVIDKLMNRYHKLLDKDSTG